MTRNEAYDAKELENCRQYSEANNITVWVLTNGNDVKYTEFERRAESLIARGFAIKYIIKGGVITAA
jgi:hypothetical protein